MQAIDRALETLLLSPGDKTVEAVAGELRRCEELLAANGGSATGEIALLLAEVEGRLLRMPHPPEDVLGELAELRISAAEDL